MLPTVRPPPVDYDRQSSREWLEGIRLLVDDVMVFACRNDVAFSEIQWRQLLGLSQLLTHACHFERPNRPRIYLDAPSGRFKKRARRDPAVSFSRAWFCWLKYNEVRKLLKFPRGDDVSPQSSPGPGQVGAGDGVPAASSLPGEQWI